MILLAFEAYLVIETVRTGFQVGLLMGFIFGTLLLLSSVLLLLFDIRRIKRKSKPISYFLLRDKSNLFKVQARHMTDTEYEVNTITLIKSGKSIRIPDKEHCKVGAERGTLAEITGFYQFLTSDFGLAEYIKKSPTFFTIGIKQRENRTIYYFKRNLGSNFPVLVKRRKILLEDGLPKTICSFAFEDCFSLEEALLPDGLHKIESYAFDCPSLKRVFIPASVTEMGDNVFTSTDETCVITIARESMPDEWSAAWCDNRDDVLVWDTKTA